MLSDFRAYALRSVACSAKMPLLQLPNCQRTSGSRSCPRGHNLPRPPKPCQTSQLDTARFIRLESLIDDLPMDRGRQGSNPPGHGLPYQPLATCGGTPPMRCLREAAPSVETRNITTYRNRVKRGNIDSTLSGLLGKGPNREIFWPCGQPGERSPERCPAAWNAWTSALCHILSMIQRPGSVPLGQLAFDEL